MFFENDNTHNLFTTVIPNRIIGLIHAPYVDPSDEVLEDLMKITLLNPLVQMNADTLKQTHRAAHFNSFLMTECLLSITASRVQIATFGLNAEKINQLSARKINQFLSIGNPVIVEQTQAALSSAPEITEYHRQISMEPQTPQTVNNLLSRLDNQGISFEKLAQVDDYIFEQILGGATHLIKLSDENIPLGNLLQLSYFQIWVLTTPGINNVQPSTISIREEAINLLNTQAPSNTL